MHIAVLLKNDINTLLEVENNCQRIPNISTVIIILLWALRVSY